MLFINNTFACLTWAYYWIDMFFFYIRFFALGLFINCATHRTIHLNQRLKIQLYSF